MELLGIKVRLTWLGVDGQRRFEHLLTAAIFLRRPSPWADSHCIVREAIMKGWVAQLSGLMAWELEVHIGAPTLAGYYDHMMCVLSPI